MGEFNFLIAGLFIVGLTVAAAQGPNLKFDSRGRKNYPATWPGV
jgi:hypothetical protein